MRSRDLKIGFQLRLGLGAIIVLVFVIAATAWYQGNLLWQQTQGLYEHPLAVRRALSELRADIFQMHRATKDLVLTENESERRSILQTIDACEVDAHSQLTLAYERYLGPKEDIDHLVRTLAQWKILRDETIQLVREGKTAEAIKRSKANGEISLHVDKIMVEWEDISKFALKRADSFYKTAEENRDTLTTSLFVIFGGVLAITAGIGIWLLATIRIPLRELTKLTAEFRKGNLHARSRYESTNEFGVLARSFNDLAQTIQAEMRRKELSAKLASVMLQEEDLRAFSQKLLTELLSGTDAQVAAIYVLNQGGTDYELYESIGLSADSRSSFSATTPEGEFGAALATSEIQMISDIPADTRFTFRAVSGDFRPREIITIPILSGRQTVAVISLTTVRDFSAGARELIRDVLGVMTARLNGVLGFQQIRDVSARLEVQNRELEAQKKELAIQADELREQNIELEIQKKQLATANRLKSSFLSNMSHELRTPLNSVIALSGVLTRRLRDKIPQDEHSYLEVIERNGKHLLELINGILDLSRIEAGREEINASRFLVQELAGEIITTITPQARLKNIELVNSVPANLPQITNDFAKCRHIVQNIVSNAVKFTERGKVEITAKADEKTIQITVSDTGIGISADQVHHIFEEFRQADESTSRKYGGTGLGLTIAKKYATLLGGRITVESSLGKGSVFTVTLPLVVAPQRSSSAGPPQEKRTVLTTPTQTGLGKSILLVEDTEPAVIQMTEILTEQGYKVRVARNGKEALEQIRNGLPDAVILDLMMPEIDGFQVLKCIRSTEASTCLPVLILTAKHITREELAFLRGNHIHQLIQKGDVSKTELIEAVWKMVSPAPLALNDGKLPVTVQFRASGRPLVLVVEDNPDNLKTVSALLRETCDLLEAPDGQAGIDLARLHKPDLVLLDISLPVIDGFKVLEIIKTSDQTEHIPVIALTARAMRGDREEILKYGFDGYVSKPVDETLLKKTMQDLLHGKA